MNKIIKTYLLALLGGLLIVHWCWSSLDPFIDSSIFESFIAHLLLVLGMWSLNPGTTHERRIVLLVGPPFGIYSVFMAAQLIPGGFEEIGLFSIVIPVYLAALGVMLVTRAYRRVPRFW